MINEKIMRRFEWLTEDEEQKDAYRTLLANKDLSKEDIRLILETVKLNTELADNPTAWNQNHSKWF